MQILTPVFFAVFSIKILKWKLITPTLLFKISLVIKLKLEQLTMKPQK